MTLAERFARYAVTDVNTPADFIRQYYREERALGRGVDVLARLITRAEQETQEDGYTLISRHDSVTGRVVVYRPRARSTDA